MTIYQMVFNAAFGTNTNKDDHFLSYVVLHSRKLPGVLKQETN